jgi:protein SCO1/2
MHKRFIRAVVISMVAGMVGYACTPHDTKLPIYGPREITDVSFDGGVRADTLYHAIPDFAFVDQDSAVVTQDTFRDKIYVADFFFTTCPTICPIMKTQMLRVYEVYKDNPEVLLLSHSIDPVHDSVAVLHAFAEKLGVDSDKWHFVTGPKEKIYEIGQESYMVTAMEDKNEPGGYLHSGAFLLIDKDRRIRGIYDGTVTEEVDQLIADIPRLLAEYGS